jgi:HAD superfamily hydrolase (TIGR01509 family)
MAQLEALLLDAYQTILYTDFRPYVRELPRIAGVPAESFYAAYAQISPLVTVGKTTVAQAFGEALTMCGVVPRPELERELADKSRDLLLKAGVLYDDVLPFLHGARMSGLKVAIVSNCDENTRDLLDELGITPLVDTLILSCEAHSAKPDTKIYTAALDALGAAPEAALFVDDNASFCAAATELGIAAVRITRGKPQPPIPGLTTIRTLPELEPLLSL